MGMKLRGAIAAANGFERLKKNLPDEASKGIEKSTRLLMVNSQKEVPRKTEQLAHTAHFVEISTTGMKRSRAVRYGEPGEGPGVIDYAAAVHEILKAKHAPPTKAKFVEDPLVNGIPDFKRFIIESVQNGVKRAFR